MVKKWLHQTLSLATVCIVLHLATSPSDARAGRLGPSRRHFPHASRVVSAISTPRLAISPPRLVTNMTTSGNNHLLLPFVANRFSKVSKNTHFLLPIPVKMVYTCCVFQPANGCSACRLLVEINFLTLKQLFTYFLVNKCMK